MSRRPSISLEDVLTFGKPVFAFPVVSKKHGERGAVYALPDGTKAIVLSNDDGMYIASPGELVGLTDSYEYTLALTEAALKLFYAVNENHHH